MTSFETIMWCWIACLTSPHTALGCLFGRIMTESRDEVDRVMLSWLDAFALRTIPKYISRST